VLMTYLATVWLVTMHGSVNGGALLHIYETAVDSKWFTNSSQQCCNRVYNFPLIYKTFTTAGLQPGYKMLTTGLQQSFCCKLFVKFCTCHSGSTVKSVHWRVQACARSLESSCTSLMFN
jgi:hypothetical protein